MENGQTPAIIIHPLVVRDLIQAGILDERGLSDPNAEAKLLAWLFTLEAV